MYSFVYIILLGLSFAVIESHDDSPALCTYSISPLHVKQYNHTSGNYVDANNTQHCSKQTDACFILWKEDPKNKSIVIYTQGCWDSNDRNCKKNECIAVKKTSKARNTSFCCCLGNFCNSNITDGYLLDPTDIPDPARETVVYMSYSMQVLVAIVATVVLMIILGIGYFLSHVYWTNPKRSNESLNLIEAPPSVAPTFDLDTLKIQKESIGQGCFGKVYCGSLNDRTVAVKIFPHVHKQYFFNEREIYMLPNMKHPSIPEYIGYQERNGEDERTEYLLVLSYCPQGCLQNFLKERTVDWSQLCKMSLSIVCGLSHLHTEIVKDDKLRHCIAHRDMTSRNILMKADGTCMVCDFGFALQVSGSKYFLNGVEGQAEADSLTEVGTLRYKAPELLEGSVNLRDLESSLKQIDIYALGLILWEIATRCSDLYQGLEVPSYKLPFEAEVGAHATTDQIKNIVVMRKTRPLFPDIWKATNPAISSLKETIEDCWDQDAEARLTALCVEERLSQLPGSWKKYKAELGEPGNLPSPTLNSNLTKSYNLGKKSSNEINIDCYGSDQLICSSERSNSLSDCTTETLLSPSSEAINCKNNLINSSSPPMKVAVPLQPFQGRNPCLARNLMQQQTEDLPVIGNKLLDCPSKYSMSKKFYSFSDGDTVLSVPSVGLENSILVNHSRQCNPIPYVQNQVNAVPKKPNMLGNHVSKDFLNKIAGLLVSLNRKASSSNCHIPEEQQLLKSSTISSPVSPSDSDNKQGQINPVGTFWSCNDVKMSNGHVVNIDKVTKPNDSILTTELLESNSVVIDMLDAKIPKAKNDPWIGNNAPEDKEVVNCCVKPNETENTDKSKRPTTLPVQPLENGLDLEGIPDQESDVDISKEILNDPPPQRESGKVVRRGSGNRRKGVKRVQTPYEITARFSLIDDRIMSSQELPNAGETNSTHSQFENVKSSASVPNMNTLYSSTQATNEVQLQKREETDLKEKLKEKPLNGLLVPVNHNGQHNVLIV